MRMRIITLIVIIIDLIFLTLPIFSQEKRKKCVRETK